MATPLYLLDHVVREDLEKALAALCHTLQSMTERHLIGFLSDIHERRTDRGFSTLC
jgi:hypothetical protein